MDYHTQEFSISLPNLTMDRSVNVLTLTEPESGTPFQLIINRDALLSGESLLECVERQMGLVTRQTKSFKLVSQQDGEIGLARTPAVLLESSFSQAGKSFYQLQAMLALEPPRLLVLTLSSPTPLRPSHRKIWSQMLETLQPRLPDAAETASSPA